MSTAKSPASLFSDLCLHELKAAVTELALPFGGTRADPIQRLDDQASMTIAECVSPTKGTKSTVLGAEVEREADCGRGAVVASTLILRQKEPSRQKRRGDLVEGGRGRQETNDNRERGRTRS